MTRSLFLFIAAVLTVLAVVSCPRPAAAVTLRPDDISWQMIGPDMVRFQLHIHHDGTSMSGRASGTLYSQPCVRR